MATLILKYTVPDDKATEILQDVTDYLGYWTTRTVQQEDGSTVTETNPVTRKQWLDNAVRDYIKSCYRSQKAKLADAYRVDAIAAADAVSVVTS